MIQIDMEMPTNCYACPFTNIFRTGCSLEKRILIPLSNPPKERPAECPLKEVEKDA